MLSLYFCCLCTDLSAELDSSLCQTLITWLLINVGWKKTHGATAHDDIIMTAQLNNNKQIYIADEQRNKK